MNLSLLVFFHPRVFLRLVILDHLHLEGSHSIVRDCSLIPRLMCQCSALHLFKLLLATQLKTNILKQIVLAVSEKCSFHRSTNPNQALKKNPFQQPQCSLNISSAQLK